MSYAALMVYVDVDGIPEQRVRITLELAAKFDAALIGFSARAVPPPFVEEGVIIELTTEADIKKMHKALAKRENWFRSIVGSERPSGDRHHESWDRSMQVGNGHASLTNGTPRYSLPPDRHERPDMVGERSVNRSSGLL